MSKRRNFSPEFKVKVALEALRGDGPMAELEARYQIHPKMIAKWKREALDGVKETFQRGSNEPKPRGRDSAATGQDWGTGRGAEFFSQSLRSVAPRPFASRQTPGHVVYPYLLGDIRIRRVNQAWCTDLSYIPMAHGSLYVVALMDWHSRKVLAWRLSNKQDTAFCVEALEEAIERYGCPKIFNTDQGSQFTSTAWTCVLKHHGIRISMDAKGPWMDNVFIERLWRSLKYECVYLHAFQDSKNANFHIRDWMDYYNDRLPHSALGYLTPGEVYDEITTVPSAA